MRDAKRKGVVMALAGGMALLLAPEAAWALGSRIGNQDAEAVARGNAFVATADNPSAIYYNPAGIRQLPGTQLRMGSYLVTVESEYRGPNGRSSTKDKLAMVPQLFGTFTPPDSRFSFGLGIYSPFGLGTEWPQDSGFRTLATKTQLTYIRVNPVIAADIAPGLSIGVGPTINYSSVILKSGIVAPGDEFSFDGNDMDFGFNAGVLWKINRHFSLGAGYHSETSLDYDGAAKAVPFTPEEPAGARLEFPRWFNFGISYRPTDRWNLEFNIDYTDWNTLNTATIRRGSGDIDIPFNWESGFMYRFGATYDLGNGWSASAGYFFTENSVPARNFSPAIPDTDLHTGSVGLAWRRGKWTLAGAAQLSTGPWRSVENSQSNSLAGESADGEYQYFIPAVNLSLGYHF
jgi:long-chain fatty acid transport protein